MSEARFVVWLLAQRHDITEIGDLARAVVHDDVVQCGMGRKEFVSHLDSRGLYAEAVAAWDEYESL